MLTFAIETTSEFVEMAAATFLIPLGFIAVDYVLRFYAQKATLQGLLLASGPDCCILSFGAAGPIVIDSHVSSLQILGSRLTPIVVVLVVLALRFLCLGASQQGKHRRSISLGLASVVTVFVIPMAAFVAERFK